MNEHYEVGKFYRVPCVYGQWSYGVGWYPVLGSFHEDAEHVGFKDWHYHIDARFLSETMFTRSGLRNSWHAPSLEAAARTFPLMLNPNPPDDRGIKMTRDSHPKPVMKRRRCARLYGHSVGMDKAPWQKSLEAAYCDKRLTKGDCPHRGADLTTMPIDRFGCVECPLHGLIFRAATGEMVPRATWNQWRNEAAK